MKSFVSSEMKKIMMVPQLEIMPGASEQSPDVWINNDVCLRPIYLYQDTADLSSPFYLFYCTVQYISHV